MTRYILKSCPVVNIRRRLNRKKKGNKIGARLNHILCLLFDSYYYMEWNGGKKTELRSHISQKMMARMMISFGFAIFLHGYFTFLKEKTTTTKKWNANIDKGGEMARPFPIKTIDLTSVQLALSLYLSACQLSVCTAGLAVKRLSIFFEVFIIYNDRNKYISIDARIPSIL